MQKVIGTFGPAGSGKDTFVKVLESFGFTRISFADPLYQEVASSYGVDIAFLQNRILKETPRQRLSLKYCDNLQYIQVMVATQYSRKTASAVVEALTNGKFDQGVSKRRIKKILTKPLSARRVLQTWGTDFRRKSKFGTDGYWLDKAANHVLSNPDVDFAFSDCRFKNEANFIESLGGVLIEIQRPGLKIKAAEHISEKELVGRVPFAKVINEEGAESQLVSIAEHILLAIDNKQSDALAA